MLQTLKVTESKFTITILLANEETSRSLVFTYSYTYIYTHTFQSINADHDINKRKLFRTQ